MRISSYPLTKLSTLWAFRPELEALLRGAPGRFAPADLGVAATPEGCAVPFHRADTPMRNSHGVAYARGRLAAVVFMGLPYFQDAYPGPPAIQRMMEAASSGPPRTSSPRTCSHGHGQTKLVRRRTTSLQGTATQNARPDARPRRGSLDPRKSTAAKPRNILNRNATCALSF